MDFFAGFYSAEGWRAIHIAVEDVGSYFIIALCVLLFFRGRHLNRYENSDDGPPDQGKSYGLVEDRSRYDNDYVDQKIDGANTDQPARLGTSQRPPAKKRRHFLRRFSDLFAFMGLVVGVLGVGTSYLPHVDQVPIDQPTTFKSRETDRFAALVAAADAHRESGELERAKQVNVDALKIPSIPIVDGAQPLANIADILVKEEQFDRAYWPALLAADLRSGQPEFVNPFAEVLIEVCELDQAVDRLDVLGLDKNERSHDLLERAEARRSECPPR